MLKHHAHTPGNILINVNHVLRIVLAVGAGPLNNNNVTLSRIANFEKKLKLKGNIDDGILLY